MHPPSALSRPVKNPFELRRNQCWVGTGAKPRTAGPEVFEWGGNPCAIVSVDDSARVHERLLPLFRPPLTAVLCFALAVAEKEEESSEDGGHDDTRYCWRHPARCTFWECVERGQPTTAIAEEEESCHQYCFALICINSNNDAIASEEESTIDNVTQGRQ